MGQTSTNESRELSTYEKGKERNIPMRIDFAKHKDEIVECVMLEDPSYVKWVLDQAKPSRKMAELQNEIVRLMDIFDRKPILSRCAGHNCNRNATRAAVYRYNIIPSWWCDLCHPIQDSNFEDKPQMIYAYQDALNYVSRCCRDRKSDYQQLIQALARSKGLRSRIDKDEAQEFFCPFPSENRFPDYLMIKWEDLIF